MENESTTRYIPCAIVNEDRTRIISVDVRSHLTFKLTFPDPLTREQFVALASTGLHFYTIKQTDVDTDKTQPVTFEMNQKIHMFKDGNETYFRIDDQKIPEDNLGDLPTCKEIGES